MNEFAMLAVHTKHISPTGYVAVFHPRAFFLQLFSVLSSIIWRVCLPGTCRCSSTYFPSGAHKVHLLEELLVSSGGIPSPWCGPLY